MEDSTSIENDLKMRPNGRNEGPTAVVVGKSYKSSLCNDGEERNEQVGNHLVAYEETIEVPVENDSHIEGFSKYGIYPKRERRPPGE